MAIFLLLQPFLKQALLLHLNLPITCVGCLLLEPASLSSSWNHAEVIVSETASMTSWWSVGNMSDVLVSLFGLEDVFFAIFGSSVMIPWIDELKWLVELD